MVVKFFFRKWLIYLKKCILNYGSFLFFGVWYRLNILLVYYYLSIRGFFWWYVRFFVVIIIGVLVGFESCYIFIIICGFCFGNLF